MNDSLQKFARKELKEGLSKLPKDWQDKFIRMYGDIETMPENKLDWAMIQVERSIQKINKKEKKC